jgi:hypothetical protein
MHKHASFSSAASIYHYRYRHLGSFFVLSRICVSNAHTLITFPPRLLVYGAGMTRETPLDKERSEEEEETRERGGELTSPTRSQASASACALSLSRGESGA